jgi:hypothetical protein
MINTGASTAKNNNNAGYNQVYTSIGSNSGSRISTAKNGKRTSKTGCTFTGSGIVARGNTLDNRFAAHNPGTVSSHAVASHSTTVGVSSYNGSRPDSAIKKKLGMSPTANQTYNLKNSKNPPQQLTAVNIQNDFKNLLYFNGGKTDAKKGNPLALKTKPVAAKGVHKKVSSMQVKNSRSKPKHFGQGLTYLD